MEDALLLSKITLKYCLPYRQVIRFKQKFYVEYLSNNSSRQLFEKEHKEIKEANLIDYTKDVDEEW